MPQDPLDRYRTKESVDPLDRYRTKETVTTPITKPKITDPLSKYETIEEEAPRSFWDVVTTPLLPEWKDREQPYTPENLPSFASRFADELLRGGYEEVREGTSPLALAAAPVLGFAAKKAVGYGAKKLPKVAEFLTKKRSLFGEAKDEIANVAEDVTKPLVPAPVEAPIAEAPVVVEPPKAIDKLLTKLDESRKLEREQAKIYTSEKAQKAAEVRKVDLTGEAGANARLAALQGEHSKVSMDPIKLEQPDVDELYDEINNSLLDVFQSANATTGLKKILTGEVPKLSEIRLLQNVFGEEKMSQLGDLLPKIDKKGTLLHELANVSRGLMTSFDLSAPGSQAKTLIHTKAWRDAWGDMVKSLGDENAYKEVMDSIMSHDDYKYIVKPDGTKVKPFFHRAGLKLTDLTSAREESTASLAERLGFGIGKGVRASNRAYTAFLNKVRADHFNRLVTNAEKAGLNPHENMELAQNIANFVNNATGRGSLKFGNVNLERSAENLNSLLFSPRLMASRLHMMNPANYVKWNTPENAFVSKQYLKSLMALAGSWGTELALASKLGAEVDFNPTSTNFMKAKWGNTTLDPGAGFQQFMVLLARMTGGEYETSTGNQKEYGRGFGTKNRFDAVMDFAVNKLHPTTGLPIRAMRANEYQPFSIGDETLRTYIPMVLQSFSEIIQDDPKMLPLLPVEALGGRVQTLEERGSDSRLLGPLWPKKFDFTIPSERPRGRRR